MCDISGRVVQETAEDQPATVVLDARGARSDVTHVVGCTARHVGGANPEEIAA